MLTFGPRLSIAEANRHQQHGDLFTWRLLIGMNGEGISLQKSNVHVLKAFLAEKGHKVWYQTLGEARDALSDNQKPMTHGQILAAAQKCEPVAKLLAKVSGIPKHVLKGVALMEGPATIKLFEQLGMIPAQKTPPKEGDLDAT